MWICSKQQQYARKHVCVIKCKVNLLIIMPSNNKIILPLVFFFLNIGFLTYALMVHNTLLIGSDNCKFLHWILELIWNFLKNRQRQDRLEKDRQVLHRVTTIGTTSDNEWERLVQQVTLNDSEWQRVVQ